MVEIEAESSAFGEDESPPQAKTSFLTSTGTREYFEAFQKRDFLEKLAQETGGNYYTVSDVERLPEEILYTQSQTSIVEVLDLWDMPFNFLLLMALLFCEWILRKRQGLI